MVHETFAFGVNSELVVCDAGMIRSDDSNQADGFNGIKIDKAIAKLNGMGFQMCGVQNGTPGAEYVCIYYFTRPVVAVFHSE